MTRLERTKWRLVELGSVAIELDDEATPYLVLGPEGAHLSGSGGCNRLVGSFERNGDTIRFTHVATTRMACAERVMQREAAFLDALAATSRFELDGDSLILLAGEDPVAILAAQRSRSS